MPNGADNFYTSDKVDLQKVTFDTQYQMKVAGNLFTPKALSATSGLRRSSSVTPWAR